MAVNISGSFVDDTNPMTGDVETVPHIGIQGPPGPQGDPGGYYVPAIEQTGENELEVSFSPSLPDMPYVAPVKVTVTPDPDSGVDLTGYATEEYVQEYAQPKGNYLESTALPTAINTALSQAKESGEFNGEDGYTPIKGVDYFDGEPGYTPQKGIDYFDGKDYVLTDNDRAEIAEQAAGLVEIPEGDGKAFIVTITESGGKYTADKTPSEIYAAHNSGVPVLASLMAKGGIVTAYLVMATEDASGFQVPNFMVGEEQLGATVIIAGNDPADRSVSIVETTIPDSGGNVDQSQIEQAVADYMEENPVEATVADGSITEEKLSDEVKASIEKAAKSGGGSAEYKWIPRGLMRDQIKTFQGWTHCVRYDERLEKAVGIVMAGEAAHTNEQPWYRVTIDGNGYMSDYEEIIIYDTDGSTVYKPNNGYVCGFCILSDGTYLIQDNDWNTDDTPNFYKSTDYGKTFTRLDIEGFPSQAFGLRQLSTGRVISGSAGARNRFYYSDDFGMTWHESNVLDTSVLGRPPFEADPAYEFAEHCIVEFQNGTLLAIGRTSNNARDQYGEIRGDLQGAAIAYSDDHGETWRDFGRSKTITNMTANNAACVYINGIYHLVVGDRYTYTTDKEGNRRYFAMYYQYATEEDALNDNWSEPVAIDYGHWHSDATAHPTDCGYPSLWKDKNDNLHCVFYDADGSGHPYGANWRLIDGNPYIQTNFVSDEHSESHCIAYSQAEVTRMLNEQRTYITNLMMGYVNDIYEKLNALPPDSDQNDGVNYITSNLLLDFNYVDASLYAADASYVKANYFANGDAYAFYPNGDTLFEVWDKFPAITHGQNGAFIWSADSDVTSKNSMSLTDIGIDSDEGFTLEFGGCVGNSYSNNIGFIGTYKYSLGGQATSWEKFYTVVSIADGKLKQMEVPFTGTLKAYGLLHAVCVYTPSAITVYYNGSAIGSVELDTEQYALLKRMTVTATNGNAAAKTINRVYNAPLTADQCMNNYKWFKNFVDNYGTESTE